MLRLSEAIKNEVMRIKMIHFGIRTSQNFYIALWDSQYLKKVHFLHATTLINRDDKRIYRATQKFLAQIALLSTRRRFKFYR